jgi:hypothetical protein
MRLTTFSSVWPQFWPQFSVFSTGANAASNRGGASLNGKRLHHSNCRAASLTGAQVEQRASGGFVRANFCDMF